VILAEDREKSTPVICAIEDFFQHISGLKNPNEMRLQTADFRCVGDFHSGFHKMPWPKVPANMRQRTKDVLDGAT
jgi:hypothetical protein